MKHVYIAGPYTGSQDTNVHNAIKFCEAVAEAGFTPFCPHLFILWQIVYPHDYEHWMKHDIAWLEKCDALLRMPGASKGADREMAHARSLQIPVFLDLENMVLHFNVNK